MNESNAVQWGEFVFKIVLSIKTTNYKLPDFFPLFNFLSLTLDKTIIFKQSREIGLYIFIKRSEKVN